MARDRPRRHVLTDGALVAIAESRPRSVDALRNIDGVSDRAASRYAEAVLSCVEAAAGGRIEAADRPVDLRPYAGTMKRLKGLVKAEADKRNLPPELLANRRALESLLIATLSDSDEAPPAEFLGWRSQVITGALLQCIHEAKQ